MFSRPKSLSQSDLKLFPDTEIILAQINKGEKQSTHRIPAIDSHYRSESAEFLLLRYVAAGAPVPSQRQG